MKLTKVNYDRLAYLQLKKSKDQFNIKTYIQENVDCNQFDILNQVSDEYNKLLNQSGETEQNYTSQLELLNILEQVMEKTLTSKLNYVYQCNNQDFVIQSLQQLKQMIYINISIFYYNEKYFCQQDQQSILTKCAQFVNTALPLDTQQSNKLYVVSKQLQVFYTHLYQENQFFIVLSTELDQEVHFEVKKTITSPIFKVTSSETMNIDNIPKLPFVDNIKEVETQQFAYPKLSETTISEKKIRVLQELTFKADSSLWKISLNNCYCNIDKCSQLLHVLLQSIQLNKQSLIFFTAEQIKLFQQQQLFFQTFNKFLLCVKVFRNNPTFANIQMKEIESLYTQSKISVVPCYQQLLQEIKNVWDNLLKQSNDPQKNDNIQQFIDNKVTIANIDVINKQFLSRGNDTKNSPNQQFNLILQQKQFFQQLKASINTHNIQIGQFKSQIDVKLKQFQNQIEKFSQSLVEIQQNKPLISRQELQEYHENQSKIVQETMQSQLNIKTSYQQLLELIQIDQNNVQKFQQQWESRKFIEFIKEQLQLLVDLANKFVVMQEQAEQLFKNDVVQSDNKQCNIDELQKKIQGVNTLICKYEECKNKQKKFDNHKQLVELCKQNKIDLNIQTINVFVQEQIVNIILYELNQQNIIISQECEQIQQIIQQLLSSNQEQKLKFQHHSKEIQIVTDLKNQLSQNITQLQHMQENFKAIQQSYYDQVQQQWIGFSQQKSKIIQIDVMELKNK